jgi:CHASE3 domain sensor protein
MIKKIVITIMAIFIFISFVQYQKINRLEASIGYLKSEVADLESSKDDLESRIDDIESRYQ